jgi:hypothetical protein
MVAFVFIFRVCRKRHITVKAYIYLRAGQAAESTLPIDPFSSGQRPDGPTIAPKKRQLSDVGGTMVQNVVCDKTLFYVIGPLPDEVFS